MARPRTATVSVAFFDRQAVVDEAETSRRSSSQGECEAFVRSRLRRPPSPASREGARVPSLAKRKKGPSR